MTFEAKTTANQARFRKFRAREVTCQDGLSGFYPQSVEGEPAPKTSRDNRAAAGFAHINLAEREGFEPPVRSPAQQISSLPP